MFSSGRRKLSIARLLVREVHVTLLQICGYVGVFVVLGLIVLEVVSGPRFERAAEKLLSSSALATKIDRTAATVPPALRGRQLP